jgi:hypothetical protein
VNVPINSAVGFFMDRSSMLAMNLSPEMPATIRADQTVGRWGGGVLPRRVGHSYQPAQVDVVFRRLGARRGRWSDRHRAIRAGLHTREIEIRQGAISAASPGMQLPA